MDTRSFARLSSNDDLIVRCGSCGVLLAYVAEYEQDEELTRILLFWHDWYSGPDLVWRINKKAATARKLGQLAVLPRIKKTIKSLVDMNDECAAFPKLYLYADPYPRDTVFLFRIPWFSYQEWKPMHCSAECWNCSSLQRFDAEKLRIMRLGETMPDGMGLSGYVSRKIDPDLVDAWHRLEPEEKQLTTDPVKLKAFQHMDELFHRGIFLYITAACTARIGGDTGLRVDCKSQYRRLLT